MSLSTRHLFFLSVLTCLPTDPPLPKHQPTSTMCKVSLIKKGGNKVPEVAIELCIKSQLLKSGQLCDAAAAKKKEYKATYKETYRENVTREKK